MTKIDKWEAADRIAAIDDEKKRALDLYDMRLVPPEDVLIFDEPTRCYRINKQWAAYVMGMVSWLAEIAPWRDADDESYFAIEEIQKFLVGVECMAFGLRQKPTDNCILQQTLDGTTWTDVFDFSLCATIQDKSYQISIQNQVTNVQETFIDIYNNYSSNYAGLPSDVYPALAPPAVGTDDSALKAALCNAIWELIRTACNAAVSYYTESINASQGEANFLIGVAAFALTAVALAAALPSAGASLVALGAAAPLIAAGMGLGAGLVNYLVDFWQQHTIDQFRDTEAMEEVACYLVDELAAGDKSLAEMQAALASHGLTGNAGVIADALSIMFQNDGLYAAFLEKWNNNKQYADAGIDLYCPCASGFKVWTWDFANGMGEFTFAVGPSGSDCVGLVLGVLDGDSVKGVNCGNDQYTIGLLMPFDPTWRVRSVVMHTRRENGFGNGVYDHTTFKMRPTANSDTGSFNPIQGGFRPNGYEKRCNVMNTGAPFYWTGANQILASTAVSYDIAPQSAIYLDKIEIMFQEDFAKGGYTTDDDNLCA